jgi:hypothetical protein
MKAFTPHRTSGTEHCGAWRRIIVADRKGKRFPSWVSLNLQGRLKYQGLRTLSLSK